MISFIISLIFPLVLAILTFLFFYKAFKAVGDKSSKFNFFAAIGTLILTIYFGINIKPPTPIIYPLDNETRIYSDNAIITIESGGFDIYYSLDGSDPQNGIKYEEPIIITSSTTVSAKCKFLWKWSEPSQRAYRIENITNNINISGSSGIGSLQTTEHIQTPSVSSLTEHTSTPTPEQISIMDVSEFYSDGIGHSKSTITDNIGNTYNGYTYMVAGDFFVESEGSVTYRNENQYNRFFGLVIIDDSEKNDEDCGWVKIYGDDSLLFDTGTMGKGVEPKDFDIDISTYSKIKIVFKHGNFSSNVAKYAQCYLVNTYFE